METIRLNTIEEAIADFKEGNFVIVVDDEDRENEGDLIIAAEKITPEKVNFMLTHGRGVLCAPITVERCAELDLPICRCHPILQFTRLPLRLLLINWRDVRREVSAYRPCRYYSALADPKTKPAIWVVRGMSIRCVPDRVESFVALDILRRVSIWLKLAGLYPAGALIEIINEDGTMARLPELRGSGPSFRIETNLYQRPDCIPSSDGIDC